MTEHTTETGVDSYMGRDVDDESPADDFFGKFLPEKAEKASDAG